MPVTCGRTSAPSHSAVPARASPRQGRPVSSRAVPKAASPRVNTIQASLPMPDGQNSIEGRKNSSQAYRLWSASGTAMTYAL